jgi:hypothetical protein
LHKKSVFNKIFVMPKSPLALSQMPPATLAGLQKLGSDLAVARLRRKESLASWASRLGTSIPTLMRLEAGEPGVSVGIYASALWLIGRNGSLADLASPENDRGALELDVREAVALGNERRIRAQTSVVSRNSQKAKATKKTKVIAKKS